MAEKHEIILELQRIATFLNKNSITRREFSEHNQIQISSNTIENKFGSWNRAIEAAGLAPSTLEHPKIADDVLLEEILRLATEIGKAPTERELAAFGKFSVRPYRARWGTFGEAVKVAYAKNKVSFPNTEPNPMRVQADTQPVTTSDNNHSIAQVAINSGVSRKKTQYGEPIDFRGLRHAPVNEQGVVYMFGMVSRELGFLIESLRTAYPDCEGKRCVDEKRQLWEHVLIEFEFKSSNFREHGHKLEGCDLIVCWIHDWSDSPLEVLELKSTIRRLPKL